MSLQKAVANALSFAHLSGIGRKPKAAAAEDKPEDDKDKPAAEDDKPDGDDGDGDGDGEDKKSTKAAATDNGDDDEPDGDKDDKKAAAAEDSDDEMRGSSAAAQARLREQSRCAAIFASPAAAKNPVMAAKLAFQTRMPRSEAVALLEGTPAPTAAVPVNPSRAARNPNVGANGGAQVSPQQAAAARWDAHLKAATPAARRRA